jgi:Recombination endonuclease VII
MANPNCSRCGNKLSKPRLAAGKRKCYRCECEVRREQKQKSHDRTIESEDFTASDYWQLYERQGGTCAIFTCRAKGKSRYLAVEHDHTCQMGHDPRRWCRACVRGLTCSPHNEWIARAGDNPEVFDSLASYLRSPPAREILMAKMIVGNDIETIRTLNSKYKVPLRRARKMLDLARGVGPSPQKVHDGTIIVRYIRIPRSDKVLYEIIETAPRLDGNIALSLLMDEYGLSERRAKSALNLAWKQGRRRVSTQSGIIRVDYHGRGIDKSYLFSIEGDSVPEAG